MKTIELVVLQNLTKTKLCVPNEVLRIDLIRQCALVLSDLVAFLNEASFAGLE